MRQKLIMILTAAFILTACNSNSKQNSVSGQTTQTAIHLPTSFYKKFTGKIGDISIVMDLTKKDSALSGRYYYTKVGLPLTLNGHISSDGKFNLSEMNDKYEETGNFIGSFLSDSTISGTWTNPKTKKSLPFNLSETTNNVVSVSFENRHSENCNNADKNKKNPSPDASMFDTLCTTLELDLIKVTAPSTTVSQEINQRIIKLVCDLNFSDKKCSTIDDLMNSVNSVEDDGGYELSIGCALVTNDNNILCVSIGQSSYGFGAAHPNSAGNYYNFDIRTGKQISLDDLLLPNYENHLNQIGEKKFIEANGSDGWDFEKGKFKLNRDFAITPGGLLFSFDSYEIGSYAMGAPEVFIPYSDIYNLIKPNGLLETWRRK